MNSFLLPPLGFLNLGPWEIALILFLALLLFGGKKLPGLAKDLGEGIREFRRSLSSQVDDDRKETVAAPPQAVESTISKSTSTKPKVASKKRKS